MSIEICKTRIKITIQPDGTEFHQAQYKAGIFSWENFEGDGSASEKAHGLWGYSNHHIDIGSLDYAQKVILAYIQLRLERRAAIEDEKERNKKTRYVIFP
ncbi:hypothetical protein [Pseudomonas phage vB_PseuGesM_254]|uniref:Uncharacterized protein n=1 Tax=Pseudomonas phage vB_PseuGesM_254 TaxID=3092638 RepID=A0AAX4G6F1_9CAUD|nr:hypothetical protein [Pseudomonas phage PseuGes_254]